MSIGGIYVVLILSVYIINSCGLENIQPRNSPVLSTNIPSESSPVVSAVLLECPKELRKGSCKAPNKQSQRPPCEQQLMVNIRVNPSFHIEKVEKFLILDEVYDPRKRAKAKIMSPYLIEISRGEPIMMYPLEFTKSVKAGGLNNDDSNNANSPECKTCNSKPKYQNKNNNNKCNGNGNGNNDNDNGNGNGNDIIKPCPKPDATTCKSGNSKLRSNSKQIKNSNEDNLENPKQESLNRVLNKITSAFGSVTKMDSDSDKKHLSNTRASQNEISGREDSNKGQERNAKMVNNDYDSEDDDDDDEWEQHQRTQDNSKRRELPTDNTNDEMSMGNQKIQKFLASNINKVTRSDGCDQEVMANVGVEEKLMKKLGKRRNNMAQIGLIRTKSNVKLTDLADDGDWSGKVKIRNISPDDVLAITTTHNKDDSAYNEREFNQNDDFVDYSSMSSLQQTDPSQIEDYNDMRIPIHPITKRRKFGRKGKHKKSKNKGHKKIRKSDKEEYGIDDEEEYEEVFSNARTSKETPQNIKRGEPYQHPKFTTVPGTMSGMEQSINAGQEGDNINALPNMQIQERQNLQMTQFDNGAEDVAMENFDPYTRQEMPMNKEVFLNKIRREDANNLYGSQINEARYPTHAEQVQANIDASLQQFNTDNEVLDPKRLDRKENVRTKPINSVDYDFEEDSNLIRYRPQSNKFSKANTKNVGYAQQNRMTFGPEAVDEYRGYNSPFVTKTNDNSATGKEDSFGNMENRYEAQNTDESFMPMRKTNGYMNNNNEEPQQESDVAENVVYEPNHENYRNPIPSNINQNAANIPYSNNNDINEPVSKVSAESVNNQLNNDIYINKMPSSSKLHESVTHYEATPENRIYGMSSPQEKIKLHYNVVLPPSKGTTFRSISPSNVFDNGRGLKSLWSYANPPQMYKPLDVPIPTSYLYTEASPYRQHTIYKSNRYKYLQTPRSAAMQLINSEPSQFLPKMPPCSRIIDDPNLNIHDKLRALDIIDPYNKRSENKLRELSREIEQSFTIYPTPFPIPFDTVANASHQRRSQYNAKKKRSFVFYDDLEMRDTLLDNDYNFDSTEHQRRQSSVPRHAEEDVTPCESCGGKGKKTHGKTDQTGQLNAQDHTCHCRNQLKPTDCNCMESKDVRSVSDAWYSVFNMSAPLPFLTTKLNIFRKRRNTWWKIVPSITLNSLSGIFANANLSILFSSHVDIFQLEKSLRLQNHQLLIPKDERPIRHNKNLMQTRKNYRSNKKKLIENLVPNLSILNSHPETILAVRSGSYDWNKNERFSRVVETTSEKPTAQTNAKFSGVDKNVGNTLDSGIRTIGELGYFPTSMNLLEHCPNDKNRLCLNMLEDRVPAYSIKVKMPFRENDIIQPNVFKLKIARIITDATTKDVLQLSVDVINKGLMPHDFSVSVSNCPQTCASKTSVKKFLVPNFSETVTFLLPLILDSGQRHKKFTCDLVVKSNEQNTFFEAASSDIALKRASINITEPKQIIVATRSFTVDPDNRCFCIWDCCCHCMPKLESYENHKVCHKLSHKEQKYAGLLLFCKLNDRGEEKCILDDDEADKDDINKEPKEEIKENNGNKGTTSKPVTAPIPAKHKQIVVEEESGVCTFVHYALILIGIMLLLGLIKALIGLCSERVDRYGYVYVQPGNCYDDASKTRRFFVNVVFFIVFPFLFWCTCFRPSEEDLLCASTEWQCSGTKGPSDDDHDDYSRDQYIGDKCTEEDEEIILSQHLDRDSRLGRNRLAGGQETGLDTRLTDWALAFHDGIFDDDDDADEEANTKFVLQALVESRESLKKLLHNRTGQMLNAVPEEEDPRLEEATALVNALKAAQIVYRTFSQPVGNVRNIPEGAKFCLQGYFLPSLGTEYEFVNYHPLAQHRCFSADGKSLEILRPPVILCPKEFSRTYSNKISVLVAGDLSIQPPSGTPCINVSTMAFVASSVAKLASEQSYRGCTTQFPLPMKAITNSSMSSQQHQYRLDEASAQVARILTQPAHNEIAEVKKVDDESCFFVENTSIESSSVQRIGESLLSDSQSPSL